MISRQYFLLLYNMALFDFLYSGRKEKALLELEAAQRTYESVGKIGNEAVRNLFEKRKAALKVIEDLEDILKRQLDFKIQYIKKIADARASIRLFTDAVQLEEKRKLKKENTVGDISLGIAMSTIFVPTAVLSSAEHTVSQGISSLTSVIIGATAVATGSAFLSIVGPIGLAIGGVFLCFLINKSKKIIEEADKMRNDIETNTQKLECVITKITQLANEIDKIDLKLSEFHSMPSDIRSAHYEEIVDDIVLLCSKINKKFSL